MDGLSNGGLKGYMEGWMDGWNGDLVGVWSLDC